MSKHRNHDEAFKARVTLKAVKGKRRVPELVAADRKPLKDHGGDSSLLPI